MDAALMVFVRRPQKGKVKTRLAATIGEYAALKIYLQLLHHTLQITNPIEVDKYVFYADAVPEEDNWQKAGFIPFVQTTGDLGHKMHHAFATLFSKGHKPVVIIGSDCIELSTALILNAFTALQASDVVLGPANDGGYYLLGLQTAQPSLFNNMPWSTASVFSQTQQRIQAATLKLHLLPQLIDIDTEEDLHAVRQKGIIINDIQS